MSAEKLIFTTTPRVVIATNTFIDVPIPLQYEDTPLIEFVRRETAGFTTQIPIYLPDGTYAANVKGSQIYETEEGKKAGLKLRHFDKQTVCELGKHTLFVLDRTDAAALRTQAELYTPDGHFVRCVDTGQSGLYRTDGNALVAGGVNMQQCTFSGVRIGIHMRQDGSVGIGVN